MKSKTIDKDLGFDSIIEDLKTLSSIDVEVGYFDDGTRSADGTMDMVDLAILQHNGSDEYDKLYEGNGTIPKRPFQDETARMFTNEITEVMHKVVAKVIDKKIFATGGLNEIGEKYTDMMKHSIKIFHTPSNSEGTIKEKGEDNPLILSESMMEAVTHELEVY